MTIDEAIRHCGKVAEEQEKLYRICPLSESEMYHCDGTKDCRVLKNGKNKGCKKCAEEHRQLVEWLEELKDYRDKNKMVVRIDVENIESVKDKINKLSKEQYNKGYADGSLSVTSEIRNKVIDDYMNKLCNHCMQQTNECYKLECPFCTDGCDIVGIAEQLKGG